MAIKINQVRLNIGRTINIGNYESLRVDVEFAATIDDNESPQSAMETLRALAKFELARIVKVETRKHKEEDIW